MNAFSLAGIVAAAVFVLIILGFAVYQFIKANRRKQNIFAPSFVRATTPKAREPEAFRDTGSLKDRQKGEGRGRFYAFGVLIAAVFGTLTVKLWSLQVLGHERYVELSTKNMTSQVSLPANRGRILDRFGNELVGNRPSVTVMGKRALAEDVALVHRLSLVLGIPAGIVRRNLLNDAEGAQSDHTIARDVPMKSIAWIREHPSLFKDVNVESHTVRYYPYGSLGAHILGYTGPVTEDFLAQLNSEDKAGYESGDITGKDGAELTFEDTLRGKHGKRTYLVDAEGRPSEVLSEEDAVSGNDVMLTLDAELQRQTDQILVDIITMVRTQSENVNCNAGALVCIDVEDGGILAASSYPTFYPAELSRGISTELWEELTNEASGYPLTNRVVSGLYPAASTFKSFTSLAGMQNDMIKDDTKHYCNGWWDEYGEEWGQRCWIYPAGHGSLTLEEAIDVSCDVFFYSVGAAFYEQWYALKELPYAARPNPFQDYVKTWGFGMPTGVDIPGEAAGRIPTSTWKLEAFADTPEEAQWQPGDMTNMCIGQGDILVTPLQLCNGYASIARQKIMTPHVFYRVINHDGQVIEESQPQVAEAQPAYTPEQRARVVEGLRRVVARDAGFNPIPVKVAGKTGTAEVAGKDDYSWFVGFAPMDAPKYCIACLIEQGGSGSLVATNGVIQAMARIYGVDAGPIVIWQGRNER